MSDEFAATYRYVSLIRQVSWTAREALESYFVDDSTDSKDLSIGADWFRMKSEGEDVELPKGYEPPQVLKLHLEMESQTYIDSESQLFDEALNEVELSYSRIASLLEESRRKLQRINWSCITAIETASPDSALAEADALHDLGSRIDNALNRIEYLRTTKTEATESSAVPRFKYDEANTAPLNISPNGDATVYWQGKWYKFTGQSADIARVLWELKTERKLPAKNRFITGEVVSRLPNSIVSPAQNIGSTMSGHPAIADGLIHNDDGLWDVRD